MVIASFLSVSRSAGLRAVLSIIERCDQAVNNLKGCIAGSLVLGCTFLAVEFLIGVADYSIG